MESPLNYIVYVFLALMILIYVFKNLTKSAQPNVEYMFFIAVIVMCDQVPENYELTRVNILLLLMIILAIFFIRNSIQTSSSSLNIEFTVNKSQVALIGESETME